MRILNWEGKDLPKINLLLSPEQNSNFFPAALSLLWFEALIRGRLWRLAAVIPGQGFNPSSKLESLNRILISSAYPVLRRTRQTSSSAAQNPGFPQPSSASHLPFLPKTTKIRG